MKKYFFIVFLTICSAMGFAQKVTLNEVKNYMGSGSTITVCGKIYGGKYLETARNTPTLLDMGANFPNQQLTLIIFGENLSDFPKTPESYFVNRNVCVTGEVIEYNGKPEIILRRPDQIQLNNEDVAKTTATPKRETPVVAPTHRTADNPKPALTAKPAENTRSQNNETFRTAPATKPNAAANTNKNPSPSVSSIATTSADDITLSGDVYMRSGPSFDYPIVSTVKAGTVVTVVFSSNGWSQVAIKGSKDTTVSEGYIKNNVLK